MEKLDIKDFVPVSAFKGMNVEEDVVYANEGHSDNHFDDLYGDKAGVWMHKDIAAITLLAASCLKKSHGWTLKINDCLRSIEAQEKMTTKGFDPSLVSLPGSGAHPRGMAIDIEPIDRDGNLVDMGTNFDFFTLNMNDNPAARNYANFGDFDRTSEIRENRSKLTDSFLWAANKLGRKINPLPQEWWDYRFPDSVVDKYEPMSEKDMPPYMRQVKPEGEVDLSPHKESIREVIVKVRAAEYFIKGDSNNPKKKGKEFLGSER
jgi:D-alanyl-D-alanine dipeptidase